MIKFGCKEMRRCWDEFIYKRSTLISIFLVGFGIYNYQHINAILLKVLGDDTFIDAIAIWLSGYLFRSTR